MGASATRGGACWSCAGLGATPPSCLGATLYYSLLLHIDVRAGLYCVPDLRVHPHCRGNEKVESMSGRNFILVVGIIRQDDSVVTGKRRFFLTAPNSISIMHKFFCFGIALL